MSENDPKIPKNRALVPYTPPQRHHRSLAQMREDDRWSGLCGVFLMRSEEDFSKSHVCALQFHFGKTFEEAVGLVSAASHGHVVHVGDYIQDIAETKIIDINTALARINSPWMVFDYIDR